MRGSFEELAHRAQQESHSYERYLLELAERECQARRGRRVERLLRESRLPLAKTLEAMDLKRLPPKVVQQVRGLLDGTSSTGARTCWCSATRGAGRRTSYRRSLRS